MHPEAPNFRALAAPFAAVPLPEVNVASSAVQSAAPYVPPVRFAARLALVRLRSVAVPLVVVDVASAVVQSAVSEVPARLAVVGLRSAQFAAVLLAAICFLEVASACPTRWAAFEALSSWIAGSPCVMR
jgi:hypothetical protein